MNFIKSMMFTVAALSSTAVLAEDGSERAGQAAQEVRFAQEGRVNDQNGTGTSRFVSSDEKPRVEQPEKSEG
ncbi:hypothetical protein [Pseudomonas sp. nanlin1]|uniref:hypothetical protein n=1 Tax=Pseudomonas sp. nanlin1 TaxID=3040605 RepID=UPI00388F3740